MPATLKLEGRVLTLEDEGTTSTIDLAEVRGDQGVKGAKGAPGIGKADLTDYYTRAEVDALIEERNKPRQEPDEGNIAFYIDGVWYQCTEGDRFYTWVDTEYNPGGRFIKYRTDAYYVQDTAQEGNPFLYYNGEMCRALYYIEENGQYYTQL